jgi:hypothetical protein
VDLQRYYGIDVTDLWRGTLTLRKVHVLLGGLPSDSPTVYALAGEEFSALKGWSFTDLLLGRMAEEFALYRWQWEAAHTDPKKNRGRPQPPRILPELPRQATQAGKVIPLVSPHRLGGFVTPSPQDD